MVCISILRRGYRLACSAHGPLGLDFEDFAERVLALTRARLARATPRSTFEAEPLDRAIERLHLTDLYLAIACDQVRDGAFELFLATYRPRLLSFLGRAGVEPARARALLHGLQGDLASPPPDGRTRTRLGTYAGASSLFSWLTVILLRRRADLARRAGAARVLEGIDHAWLEARASAAPGPLDELLGREAGSLLASVLRATYDELTSRERLCLLCRFQEDLAQRDIARLLGIGEPRVSRLLEQAIVKLRRNLQRASAGDGLVPDERAWSSVRDAVAACLRSLRAGPDDRIH